VRKTIAALILLLSAACKDSPQPPDGSVADADSSAFAAVGAYAASIHSPSGTVLVHGQTVYSWGDTTAKLQIHSIRKSFLDSLYGAKVAQGQIALSSTLGQLGINDANPALTTTELTATVQDLLEARSGVYHVANYETASEVTLRPAVGSHAPGTFFYYNNWDFNAAGAVYERETGTSIFTAFENQIARPIGMQDYAPTDGLYEWSLASGDETYASTDGSTPSGAVSTLPAYTFSMSTRDMARFGQLFLQKGMWNGTQVVPASWVAASTTSYSVVPADYNDPPGEGYGYLWWIGGDGAGLFFDVDLGAGCYSAIGSGGHHIVVAPAFDLVVVVRADDAYYEADEATNNIGPHLMGQLMSRVLAALDVNLGG
jgi:CubicO group peptidase (beta-lactamase class C family)